MSALNSVAKIAAALLAVTLAVQGHARDCSASGALGLEVAQIEARSAVLNPSGDFLRDSVRDIVYGELDSRCFFGSSELRLKVFGEHLGLQGGDGFIQRSQKNEFRGMLREGYLSLRPLESLFIDIGKKDIRNGQLFFVSPMDVLQNPANYGSQGYVNARGVSWRDTYREGAMVVHGTWLGALGNLELGLLPKLADASVGTPVADRNTLQRTNSNERYYVSLSVDRFEDFNPKLVAVFGADTRVGLGVTGFVNDDLIFTAEAAIHSDSDIRKIKARQVERLLVGDFPAAAEMFIAQERDVYGQLALGLRHTTAQALDISVEYLFQEQGYSNEDWDNYFDFLEVSEGAYQISGFQEFRGYVLVAASEVDDLSRRDLMMGRNYLMTHLRRAPQSPKGLGWESSVIFNIDDESYSLNLHAFSQVHRHVQFYVGGGYSGGAQRSEFGRFGNDGIGYAGVRAIW